MREFATARTVTCLKRLAILSIALLSFGVLSSRLWDFVLDDAYIAYRFALNLSEGHGIVWNVGQDPVEGFTSLLWVLLIAAGTQFLGVDPVQFSKIASVVFAGFTILFLFWMFRRSAILLSIIYLIPFAFSPAFAYLTVQGLETPMAVGLVMVLAKLSIDLLRRPSTRNVILWPVIAFLGVLARPDIVVFITGVVLGSIIVRKKRGRENSRSTLLAPASILLALLLLLTTWRLLYFGELFPMPFYVKQIAGPIIEPEGVKYLRSFALWMLLPYSLVLLTSRSDWYRQMVIPVVPILIGVLLQTLYILSVNPIQGEFWRFLYPAFGPFLVAISYLSAKSTLLAPRTRSQWAGLAILTATLFLWSGGLWRTAVVFTQQKNTLDRAAVGRKLAGLEGSLFTSESGALPYYSNWNSVDNLGLTSIDIAKNGLSRGMLEAFNPDLIALISIGPFSTDRANYGLLRDYMVDEGYQSIAAIAKVEGKYHVYFSRPESQQFDELTARIIGIQGLTYADLNVIVPPELRD